jgi:hypothetical protein
MAESRVKTAEEFWERFVAHLNEVVPLGKRDEVIPHKAFIGSIEKYNRIYMEANRLSESDWRTGLPFCPFPRQTN